MVVCLLRSINSETFVFPRKFGRDLSGHVLAVGDASQSGLRIYERCGLSVTECSNGKQAIDILKQHHYLVVLCDFKIVGMGSMDLLNRVSESYPDIAFVMTVELQDLRYGILAMIDGASGYIVKLQQSETVLRAMKVALVRNRLNRALACPRGSLG